jgi:hypothetical protein
MSKQLMIYDNIQPLSEKHAKWSVHIENYAFVESLNSVPLLATEIPLASTEYPVIFSETAAEGEFIPLAVLGLKNGQNLFLNDDKAITARFVPAFIRRYPFVLGGNKGSDTMAVCIDEDSKSCVHDGSKGFRLFTDDGQQSESLKTFVEFLKDFQYRSEMTKVFCKHLNDLGLLEPMQANITIKSKTDATLNLTGFYVVNREKLKALGDADLLALFKKDGLELIYAHLQSLSNLNKMIDVMAKKMELEAA